MILSANKQIKKTAFMLLGENDLDFITYKRRFRNT